MVSCTVTLVVVSGVLLLLLASVDVDTWLIGLRSSCYHYQTTSLLEYVQGV